MGPTEALLIAAALVILFTWSGRRARQDQLRALERRLDRLIAQLGIQDEVVPPVSETVAHLTERGEIIAAIKAFREETGVDLKEAKDRIDLLRGKAGARPDLTRVIRKLDAVLRSFDIEPEPAIAVSDEIIALVRAGQTVEAIKLVREANPGLGLADAKTLIERL